MKHLKWLFVTVKTSIKKYKNFYDLEKIIYHHHKNQIHTSIATGDEIVIEERSHEEMIHINGKIICALDVDIINPGFDVIPNELITGIITEVGILRPDYKKSITEALKKWQNIIFIKLTRVVFIQGEFIQNYVIFKFPNYWFKKSTNN